MTYEKNGHKFLRSTTDLDTKAFANLMDFTRSFGENHGCYIMTPEEYLEYQFQIEREFNL